MIENQANLSILTYNAHLFGQSAEFICQGNRCETGFYFQDRERLPEIIRSLRNVQADVVGLTEIWDADMRATIEDSLSDLYPYRARTAVGPGLGQAIATLQNRWPRLAQMLFSNNGSAIDFFSSLHYTPGREPWLQGLKDFFSEDRMAQAVARWSRLGSVFGAGLLLLSRHPILVSEFHPHRDRAEWDHLAGKGVLEAEIALRGQGNVAVSLGHFQEGLSRDATDVRFRQVRRTADRWRGRRGPLIKMGDYNVPGETDEHRRLAEILQLQDASGGFTYEEPNPYQDKLKAPRPKAPERQRIDYIFHSPDLWLRSARVLRSEFRAEPYDLSDHFPLLAEFIYDPREAISGVYSVPAEIRSMAG